MKLVVTLKLSCMHQRNMNEYGTDILDSWGVERHVCGREPAPKHSMWAVLSRRILSFAVAAAASHQLPSSGAQVFSSHRGLSAGVCIQNEPDDTSVALCEDWCSEPAHCASRTLRARSLSSADLLSSVAL